MAGLHQWYDELGTRDRVASDVAREIVNIGDTHSCCALRSAAADPRADRDPYAGGFALERAEYQLRALAKIKSGPIDIGQRVINERRGIRRIGDEVRFSGEQRIELTRQIAIE